jgi:SAM-dependent methyltransferase
MPAQADTPSDPHAPEPAHRPEGLKEYVKHLAARSMRPGLLDLSRRLEAIEQRLGFAERDRAKYEGEIAYWRDLVKHGGCERQHGDSFENLFGRWQRERLIKLGQFLGLPPAEQPGGIDDWASVRSVVEIGAGPYPAIAAVKKRWRRAVAVDPIARGYTEEGLLAQACEDVGVVYIDSPGEAIPLPTASIDLVITDNCLDHVADPPAVVREMHRLLKPGGYLWLFVDLSNHVDYLHPHAMNEDKVRTLMGNFSIVREEVSRHKAHPQAYGGFRGLWRKPEHDLAPSVRARVGAASLPLAVTTDGTKNGPAKGV